MKTNKINISAPLIASVVLASMTRDDLRAVATAINVPRGKDRKDTEANLLKAVKDGKLNCKLNTALTFKPADGSAMRKTFYASTLRTYISGPGKGNEKLYCVPLPVKGQDVAAADSPEQ